MTKKEWIAVVIVGALAVCLLLVLWPYPRQLNVREIETEQMLSTMREQKKDSQSRASSGKSLLEEMEKAAAEMADEFPAVRKAMLEAAKEGKLTEVKPYRSELPLPGDVVVVNMMLVLDDAPTFDREKGRTRISIAGLDSIDFDNEDKKSPNYNLLGSVLATMHIRRQVDSGEGLVVEILPTAFVPIESVRKVVEAAARAGVTRIRFKQPPVPY